MAEKCKRLVERTSFHEQLHPAVSKRHLETLECARTNGWLSMGLDGHILDVFEWASNNGCP
jgi:hypothetical protein